MDLVKHLFDRMKGGTQCALAVLLSFTLVASMVPVSATPAFASEAATEETTGEDPPESDESETSDALAELEQRISELEAAQNAASESTQDAGEAPAGSDIGEVDAVEAAFPIIEGIEADEEVPGVATITEGGVYALVQNAAGTIAIATSEPVILTGTGCAIEEDGSISSSSALVRIDATAASCADLTLQDLHIYADGKTALPTGERYLDAPIVSFAGAGNTLTIKGSVSFCADDADADRALINVPADADLTLKGEGALYLSQKGRGAAIGGNAGEANGSITVGTASMEGEELALLAKAAGAGAVIGSGANAAAEAGAITFRNSLVNLAATGSAPAVGTTASDEAAGPLVAFEAPSNVNINICGEGAAIRTGASKIQADAGALRTHIGATDAARSAWGEAADQVTDAALAAAPQNADGQDLVPFALDTQLINAAEPWNVCVDGVQVYQGGFNRSVFVQEAVDAGLLQSASVAYAPQNWTSISAASEWDPNLYLHLTPESHVISVGDQLLLASWDEEAASFTVADLAMAKARSARAMERKVVASVTGAGTFLVNNAQETISSGTVTVTATPADGSYLAQIRMAEGSANTGLNLDYRVLATPGANGEGEGNFSMTVDLPVGSEDVSIVADFIPIVWDGTLDTTWYDPEQTTYNLSYPAQFEGAAAIINGCFTTYPVKENGSPDYAAYQETMGYQENADGTVQNQLYGVFSSTYTQPDAQGFLDRTLGIGAFGTIDGFGFSAPKTRITRVVGDAGNIVLHMDNTGGSGAGISTSSERYYGSDDFAGKIINISRDMDFGAFVSDIEGNRVYEAVAHKWSTDSPVYMTLGGSYDMIPLINNTNGQSIIGSSFNGTLDGCGHTFVNLYGEHFTAGTNYGDCQGVGVVGTMGAFKAQDLPSYGRASDYTVSVRRLVVDETCYFSGRRSTGGIVGRTVSGSNAVVEYCINKAFVKGTDKFGCAGIVGGAYANGVIDNCANFGPIWQYLDNPAGGIVGYNHMEISNCFNAGFVNAGGTTYSMGIGTCDSDGPKTVTNCYYVNAKNATAANPDTALGGSSGGYFVVGASDTNNGATAVVAGKATGTAIGYNNGSNIFNASHMNNGGAAIWVDDIAYNASDPSTKGVNWSPTATSDAGMAPARNMPMLWFQGSGAADSATYKVTVDQPRGGTVSVSATSGSFGDRIFFSHTAEKGYLFVGYTVEIEGVGRVTTTQSSMGLTGDMTVTAEFEKAEPAEIEWETPRDGSWDLDVTYSGIKQSGSSYVDVVDEPVRNGGEVLQGNTLTFTPRILKAPADETREYTGVFTLEFRVNVNGSIINVQLSGNASKPATYVIPAGARSIEIADDGLDLKTEFKSWATKADTDWFDLHSADTQFTISTPEELAGVAVLTEQGITFEGKTISLAADLDMTYVDDQGVQRYWQSIGLDEGAPFSGTFDGQGHTITGLRGFTVGVADNDPRLPDGVTYTQGFSAGALFGLLSGATVKNVTIGADNTSLTAGIALKGSMCAIENCVNDAVNGCAGIIVLAGASTAGDVPLIKNCVNNADITGVGIVYAANSAVIEGCVNNGAIAGPGGILGDVLTGGTHEVTISDCANHGDVTYTKDVTHKMGQYVNAAGGILGDTFHYRLEDRATIAISGCVNTGCINNQHTGGWDASAGGIVGYASIASIQNCYNTGAVHSALGYAGGIAGALSKPAAEVEQSVQNCYSTGSVSTESNFAAEEICGSDLTETQSDPSTIAFANCYAFNEDEHATLITEEELRALVPVLGEAFKVTMPDVNDGYPMLAWELPYELKYVTGTGETVCAIGMPAGYTNTDEELVGALFTGDLKQVSGEGARKGYNGLGFGGWVSERNGSDPVVLQNVGGDVLAWPVFTEWVRDLSFATISGHVASVVNGVISADINVVHDGTRLEEGVHYSITCTPNLSGSQVTVAVTALGGSACTGSAQAVFAVGGTAKAVCEAAGITLESNLLGTSYAYGDQKLIVIPVVESFYSVEEAYSALKSSDLVLPPAGMDLVDFLAFDVKLFMIDLADPAFRRDLTEFANGLTITFKVADGPDAGSLTAFVTQLHEETDGSVSRPLDQAQFPVSDDGLVTITVDKLSSFAITLASGEPIQGPVLDDPATDDPAADDEQAFRELLDRLNQLLGQMAANGSNGAAGSGAQVGGGNVSVPASVGAGASTPYTPSAGATSSDAGAVSSDGDVVGEGLDSSGTASTPIPDDIVPSAESPEGAAGVVHDTVIPWWVWLVAALAACAVAGSVILVIMRRKKAEEELQKM